MRHEPAFAAIATPIGIIELTATREHVTRIVLTGNDGREQQRDESPALDEAVAQLRAYFAGERREFDLPLEAASTARGAAIRDAMRAIACGDTMTYGGLARAIGSSARAIGQACGRNPFPIVVPCHRVLSAPGGQENYSAGRGVETKAWLLAHEVRMTGG